MPQVFAQILRLCAKRACFATSPKNPGPQSRDSNGDDSDSEFLKPSTVRARAIRPGTPVATSSAIQLSSQEVCPACSAAKIRDCNSASVFACISALFLKVDKASIRTGK